MRSGLLVSIQLAVLLLACDAKPPSPGPSTKPPAEQAAASNPSGETLAHAIGIETAGGQYSPLLAAGAALPASHVETFTASPAGVSISLAELTPGRPTPLAKFTISELPAEAAEVQVSLTVDDELRLHATAAVPQSEFERKYGPFLLTRAGRAAASGPATALKHPLEVALANGAAQQLIAAGEPLPVRALETFVTSQQNQSAVEVALSQKKGDESAAVAKFVVDGLPPAGSGGVQVMLTFDVDGSRQLRVRAQIPDREFVREFGPFAVE